ncbi:MAG: PKD domain-containing protein [Baekduia sp.]
MRARLTTTALLTAAALAAGTTAASAAGLEPVWQPAQTFSAESGAAHYANVATSPDGRVVVAWNQIAGGLRRAFARVREADGTWGEARVVSDPDSNIAVFDTNLRVAVGPDGTAVVLWLLANGTGEYAISHPNEGWTPATSATEPGEMFTGSAIASGPDGVYFLTTGSTGGGDWRSRLWRFPAGADALTLAETFDEPDTGQGDPALSFAPNGNAIASWQHYDNGNHLRYALRDPATGEWSGATTGFSDGNDISAGTAIDSAGRAVAVWNSPSSTGINAATMSADHTWSPPHTLFKNGPNTYFGQARADADGNFVVVWQEFNGGNFADEAHVTTATFDADAQAWGDPEPVASAWTGAPMLSVNRHGDMLAAVAILDGGSVKVGSAFRPSGGRWGDIDPFFGEASSVGPNGLLGSALDDNGNAAITLLRADTPTLTVAVAEGDGDAPDIDGLSVPATATTGERVAVSAGVSDTLSGVASTAWEFGDGGSASGEAASHVYAAAGTYSLRVTAIDNAGHVTTETRMIAVSDPPAPPADDGSEDDPPPVVTPPVIEARLSGRTITLNAKLTLKKGKRCSGTVRATTAFGGRSYKTTLRLSTKNGACRATGTIKLKKTPSLRTKLRITVSGAQAKTRALTTRRG